MVDCPICSGSSRFLFESGDLNYHHVERTFSLYQCRQCGSVFQHPLPDNSEINKFYPDHYLPHTNHASEDSSLKSWLKQKRDSLYGSGISPYFFLSALKRPEIELITEVDFQQPLTHLDVGCGTGDFLERIQRLFPVKKSVGIDPSQQAVESTRDRGFEAIETSIEQFNPGTRFNLISANHVLEHLSDPHKFLNSIKKLLTSNGYLVLSLPNAGGLGRKLFGKYWVGFDVPRHLISYSKKSLLNLLNQHGFSMVKYKTNRFYLDSLKPLLGFRRHQFSVPLSEIFTAFLPFLLPGLPWDNQVVVVRQGANPAGDSNFIE